MDRHYHQTVYMFRFGNLIFTITPSNLDFEAPALCFVSNHPRPFPLHMLQYNPAPFHSCHFGINRLHSQRPKSQRGRLEAESPDKLRRGQGRVSSVLNRVTGNLLRVRTILMKLSVLVLRRKSFPNQ